MNNKNVNEEERNKIIDQVCLEFNEWAEEFYRLREEKENQRNMVIDQVCLEYNEWAEEFYRSRDEK